MKQYSKKAIGLILLIVITSLVLAFLVAGQFYISAFIAGMILLIEAWYLLRQMERSDRLFRHFVWSVRYSDFLSSGATPQEPSDALPQELTEAVEEALQFYKKHLQQKESQLQYFQALAQSYRPLRLRLLSRNGTGRMDEPGSQNTNRPELC